LIGINHLGLTLNYHFYFDSDFNANLIPSATFASAGNNFTAASASRSLYPKEINALSTSLLADFG
jgi:hypothetical protein